MESFSQADRNHNDIFLEAMEKGDKKGGAFVNPEPVKKGVVVEISESGVFLDLGSKSEVFVPLDEFGKNPPSIGDEITVIIKEMKDGIQIGSTKAASRFARMSEIKHASYDGLPVRGSIKEVIYRDSSPKGFTVDLGYDISAFLPYSHIDTKKVEKLEDFIGKSMDFAILEYKPKNITVSRRDFLRKTIKKVYENFYNSHSVGDVVKGTVEEVYEAFLILNVENIRAFMHISDFSWKYLKDLNSVVKIGDEFEVQVLSIEKAKDSVKIGRKQLLENPWNNVEDRYSSGDMVKAKVLRFRRDGAIVEIEEGIEAFVHVNEMSWTQKSKNPKKFLKVGDIVQVKIKDIDVENLRIDVSVRDVEENPWEKAAQTYTRYRKLKGIVSSVFDFGAFVKFDDGIEGLLRKEDIDWVDTDIDPKKKLKKGEEIEVIVLSLDANREKLRLGIKQLSDNPYKVFSMNYPKGSPVTGKVKSILENGVIVELENNLEGFIHISQIDKANIENVADAVSEGEEITALVKFVDFTKNKIELSRKDYLFYEERQEVDKYIVTGNDGALETSTSLGSLLKDQFDNLNLADDKKAKKETKTKAKKDTEATKSTKTAKDTDAKKTTKTKKEKPKEE
jgi:small subunit ribosomal protein S1